MDSLSLKTVLLVLVLQNINCDVWNVELDQLVTFSFEDVVISRSAMSCLAHCASIADPLIEKAAVKDGLCYCLNPQPNAFFSYQLVNVSLVFALSTEPICRHKGYEIVPEFGICMKYFPSIATWTDAQYKCNQDGGYLINLNTVEKATAILNMTLAYNQWLIHIGGFMSNSTMKFNWTRGGVIDGQFWAEYEPTPISVDFQEYCLAVFTKDGVPLFGNLPCSMKMPYLCELLL